MLNSNHYLDETFAKLRKENIKKYFLISFSCLISSLFIIIYTTLITIPAVENILPKGGNTRTQIIMVFTMSLLSCILFVIYSMKLYLKWKSKEIATFKILGLDEKSLINKIFGEVTKIIGIVSVLSIVVAIPILYCLMNIFQNIMPNTEQLTIQLSATHLVWIGYIFSILGISYAMIKGHIKNKNLIEMVRKEQIPERMPKSGRKYFVLGVILLVSGLLVGYGLPFTIMSVLSIFPHEIFSLIGYIPMVFGIYYIILGRFAKKSEKAKNKNIITENILKLEYKQTVNNMLIITLLVFSSYFAGFYIPTMASSVISSNISTEKGLKSEFHFDYRADQNILEFDDIESIAKKYDLNIVDYMEVESATLGIDGEVEKLEDVFLGTAFYNEYYDVAYGSQFVSEAQFNALTKQNATVDKGEFKIVYDEGSTYNKYTYRNIEKITNPVTNELLQISKNEEPLVSYQFAEYLVLNNEDYNNITANLNSEYIEKSVFFDVSGLENNSAKAEIEYAFADELLTIILKSSTEDVAVDRYYDPIYTMAVSNSNDYLKSIDLSNKYSSELRLDWKYMPEFLPLENKDFVSTYSVYLVLFMLVTTITFLASLVVLYVRCSDIILTNKKIFTNMKYLGATNKLLQKNLKKTISTVFFTPVFLGSIVNIGFYSMILIATDGVIESVEAIALLCGLGLVGVGSFVYYFLYKCILSKNIMILKIS